MSGVLEHFESGVKQCGNSLRRLNRYRVVAAVQYQCLHVQTGQVLGEVILTKATPRRFSCPSGYQELLGDEDIESGFDTDYPGLAREMSRGVLSVNNYTEWYWKMDLHNLFHY